MDLISAARRTGRALRQEVIKMALPTIPSTQVVYTMSPHNAPAARCASGGTLCFETLDCFGGQITSPDQRLGGLDWDHINPATGPLYVEGARPGDVTGYGLMSSGTGTMDKVHVVKGKLQGGAINMVGSDGMPNECDIVYIGGQVWQVYGDELGNLAPEKAPWWASMHTFTGAVAWQRKSISTSPKRIWCTTGPSITARKW